MYKCLWSIATIFSHLCDLGSNKVAVAIEPVLFLNGIANKNLTLLVGASFPSSFVCYLFSTMHVCKRPTIGIHFTFPTASPPHAKRYSKINLGNKYPQCEYVADKFHHEKIENLETN